MNRLHLPSFDAKIRKNDKAALEIFDPLRKKYVALTAEEWVRQHFVHYLISEKNYPASHIANEMGIKYHTLTRRCDTVVYDDRLQPIMVIEYKEPEARLTQKVFDQITRYNSVLRVPYIAVSNGMTHYCCHLNYEQQSYRYLENFPDYRTLQPL